MSSASVDVNNMDVDVDGGGGSGDIRTAAESTGTLYSPHSSGLSPERGVMLQRYLALTSKRSSIRRRQELEISPSFSTTSSDAPSLTSPPASPSPSHSSPPEMSSSPSSSSSSTSEETDSTSSSPTLPGHRISHPPPFYALPKPSHHSVRKTSSQQQQQQQCTTMSAIPEDASLTSEDFSPTTTSSPALSPHTSRDPSSDRLLFEVNYDIKATLTDLLNCEAVRRDAKMRAWVQMRLMEAELELKQRRRERRVSAPPGMAQAGGSETGRRASAPGIGVVGW